MQGTRASCKLLGLTWVLVYACCAHADYRYSFQATTPAPLAGPITGYFTVSSGAIADGFISASEITGFSYPLLNAEPPFIQVTFGPPDTIQIISPYSNRIKVDPLSGAIADEFAIRFTNAPTSEQLVLTFAQANYFVNIDVNSAAGKGVWSVESTTPLSTTPVPTVGYWSLILLSISLVAIGLTQLRKKPFA